MTWLSSDVPRRRVISIVVLDGQLVLGQLTNLSCFCGSRCQDPSRRDPAVNTTAQRNQQAIRKEGSHKEKGAVVIAREKMGSAPFFNMGQTDMCNEKGKNPWRIRRDCGGGRGGPRAEAPGAAGAAGSVTGALRASPAAAPSSASSSASSSSPPQLALLVMQPCGGEEAAAAGAAGGVLPLPGADPPLPPPGSGGLMLFYELGGPGDGEAEAGEEAEAAGGESTASPEELEEEEAATAAAAATTSSGEAAAGGGCKSCTYQGCSETTTQVVKQRKPWMCKRHRNKIYKDKYKRKKSDQALGGGGAAAAGGGPRAEDSVEGSVSVSKQRTGSIGDRPARPTLLEQVLNKKRLSLLRSPEVVQFLQKQQQLLSQQALEQRQQQFQGAPG
ncbi:regulatory factor X-associated protein [Mycteria americana]|uniref:regulatory factor X-associated protein n=1 Tax=Mycteria americana TaxID=33587 RepID=UPI003F58149C